MTDSKYFTTNKKGEIFELKAELNNEKKEKRKEAVKKVIAAMTVGKDVSSLFPDVVNCMQTDNLELKKLVYLYLMNYAKSQPDMAIMAVNSFVKDCEDPNPLIRALAVRTMGCIRVDKITEYLCEPLRKCLKDEDPYVRKTAAVCVAKLHDINAQMVEDQGFLDSLRDLIADSNPMVTYPFRRIPHIAVWLEQQAVLLGFGEGPQVDPGPPPSVIKTQSHRPATALRRSTVKADWKPLALVDVVAGFRARGRPPARSVLLQARRHSGDPNVIQSAAIVRGDPN
ncbi:AP-2 complex subunit beta-like [Sphaerodactylus townsendi]|uniref:AP-2 complex subunit beta-like n=1 Tax=Sphaerodactylus townsendi TaxID=933632 RepID=UPI002025E50D|nr:AP-2 complex subunit beta-like [Sphaerodactylus townsendi]